MKHYSIGGASAEKMQPWLLFDVKFDIRDIRSRLSETLERSFQAQMLPMEEDLMWTPDMVIEREADFLDKHAQEISSPPGFDSSAIDGRRVESKFLEYLLRHHKIMVHKNSVYDVYSTPAEPYEDFQIRCQEEALEDMHQDFRSVGDQYHRRLRQLEQSAHRATEALDTDVEKLAQLKFELNRIFLELNEDISSLFLEPEFTHRVPRPIACGAVPEILDLSEKLDLFQKELYTELTHLKGRYRSRAESVEPFQLPLTLHQTHVVGAAILWHRL